MSTLFCRHNRFTADCPICSKGTVLDSSASTPARPSATRGGGRGSRAGSTAGASGRRFTGPYVEAGPYEDADGESYRVRLERVPGGMRLGEWARGELRRRAPVLPPADLRALVVEAADREILAAPDTDRLVAAVEVGEDRAEAGPVAYGASRGRAGDLQDELRVEGAEDASVRVVRWMLRPGRGWERHDAAPMLPAARYAEALRGAVGVGLLGSDPRSERPLHG